MTDLVDYYMKRIEALENELTRMRLNRSVLETYIYELTDKDCPDEYKTIVKQCVFYDDDADVLIQKSPWNDHK